MRVLLAWLVVLLAVAAPASAGTLSVQAGTLTYEATQGDEDIIEAYPDAVPGTVVVYDWLGTVTAGPGCVPAPDPFGLPGVYLNFECAGVDAGAALTMGDGSDAAFVDLADLPVTVAGGDGDDLLGTGAVADELDGGPGNDELIGGLGQDRLAGGEGDDRLIGDWGEYNDEEGIVVDASAAARRYLGRLGSARRAGESPPGDGDVLDGGAGDDVLQGNGGADVLTGGDGLDIASYSGRANAVSVTLDGLPGDGEADEGDTAGADVEGAETGIGNDSVVGGAAAERILTGAGDDNVTGGGGADIIDLGPGNDTASTRDGSPTDKLSCGEGADRATIDPGDQPSECESVDPPPGASGRVTPTGIKLHARRRGPRVHFSGRLQLPAGADRRLCAGAPLLIELRGRGVRRNLSTTLGSDCTFSGRARVRARASALATFAGTQSLAPAQSRRIAVRG